jgi:hypothetical protein
MDAYRCERAVYKTRRCRDQATSLFSDVRHHLTASDKHHFYTQSLQLQLLQGSSSQIQTTSQDATHRHPVGRLARPRGHGHSAQLPVVGLHQGGAAVWRTRRRLPDLGRARLLGRQPGRVDDAAVGSGRVPQLRGLLVRHGAVVEAKRHQQWVLLSVMSADTA